MVVAATREHDEYRPLH